MEAFLVASPISHVSKNAVVRWISDVVSIERALARDIFDLAIQIDPVLELERRAARYAVGQGIDNTLPVFGHDLRGPFAEVDLGERRVVPEELVTFERPERFARARVIAEVAHPANLLMLDHRIVCFAKGLLRCGSKPLLGLPPLVKPPVDDGLRATRRENSQSFHRGFKSEKPTTEP